MCSQPCPVGGKGGRQSVTVAPGACARIVTPAQPFCAAQSPSPAHFHSAGRLPLACFPSWAGMRCQGMTGKTVRASSPPPRSGCECQANFIRPGSPLSPEPLGRLPFADALLEWGCALPGTGCLPAQPCFPGRPGDPAGFGHRNV